MQRKLILMKLKSGLDILYAIQPESGLGQVYSSLGLHSAYNGNDWSSPQKTLQKTVFESAINPDSGFQQLNYKANNHHQ